MKTNPAWLHRLRLTIVVLLAGPLLDRAAVAQTGACCVGTTCTIRTFTNCDNAGGDWQGPGTGCSGNTCGGATVGACCDVVTRQCTATAPTLCTGSRIFMGLGVSCNTNPCLNLGGCCNNSTLACTVTTASACGSGSTWLGAGSVCAATSPCGSLGACCERQGLSIACRITSSAGCLASGSGQGFQGPGTACGPLRCAGACCEADGDCTLTNADNCESQSRVYAGNNTTCTANGCAPFLGACCDTQTGSCTLTMAQGCQPSFNPVEFKGAGTTCTADRCRGACCNSTLGFLCVVRAERTCTDAQGTYRGDFTTCSPCNDCLASDPTGTCCLSTGCSITRRSCCTGDGGRFQTSSCTPSLCAGACCVSAGCITRDGAECAAAGGAFQGLDSACGLPGNPTTCCPANFNQQGGVTVQDIFDFLAAYFAVEFAADFNNSMSITVQDIFDFLAAYFAGCN